MSVSPTLSFEGSNTIQQTGGIAVQYSGRMLREAIKDAREKEYAALVTGKKTSKHITTNANEVVINRQEIAETRHQLDTTKLPQLRNRLCNQALISKATLPHSVLLKGNRHKFRKIYTSPVYQTPTPIIRKKKVNSLPTLGYKKAQHDLDQVLVEPVNSEKALSLIPSQNTITFNVHKFSTKTDIKKAFEKIYNVKVVKVCTLNTMKGTKKAYIRLNPENDAHLVAQACGLL